jgi:hypothetical protein
MGIPFPSAYYVHVLSLTGNMQTRISEFSEGFVHCNVESMMT